MIRVVEGMPAGTVGVEAVGRVTEADYRIVLVPTLTAALERGGVRLLYVLGEDFDSYTAGTMWADTKLWAGHVQRWDKIAIVSDAKEWVTRAGEDQGAWAIGATSVVLAPVASWWTGGHEGHASGIFWWPGAGSNRRPSDFQSDARTN